MGKICKRTIAFFLMLALTLGDFERYDFSIEKNNVYAAESTCLAAITIAGVKNELKYGAGLAAEKESDNNACHSLKNMQDDVKPF